MRCAARVATHRAICQISPVEFRLHVLFWHLAERWGHVAADSVVLPVPLRHETLGRLAAAKRPTVTLALQKLAMSELVHRRADGAWLLHGTPPAGLRVDPHAASAQSTLGTRERRSDVDDPDDEVVRGRFGIRLPRIRR
jgi:hypothetical protein